MNSTTTQAGPTGLPPAPEGDLTLLLNALQSPINIGMILRVAETYGVSVAIAGSDAVLEDHSKTQTISDFACGALQRKGFARQPAIAGLLGGLSGRRLIATTIVAGAESLERFHFQPGDVVLLGNEYDGLPDEVVRMCSHALRIPMADVWTPKPPSSNPIDPARTKTVARDGSPNLNVAMAATIICYQWFVSTALQAENRARS